MKSKNLVAMAAVALLVILIALLVIFVILPKLRVGSAEKREVGRDGQTSVAEKQQSVLSCTNTEELETYIKKNKLGNSGEEFYYSDETGYYFAKVDLAGAVGTYEAELDGEDITHAIGTIYVYPIIDESAHEHKEGELEEGEYYDENGDIVEPVTEFLGFTDDEKAIIKEAFWRIELGIEDYLNCGTIPYCDYLPAKLPKDGETVPEDKEEAFFEGYYIKEMSIRDAQGTLWMIRYAATTGMAVVKIIKVIDQTEYENYIPIIDMTKY